MTTKKPLSRRAFLRGSGGVMVALPFLEAMIPILARAQTAQAKRFILAFNGSVNGNATYATPGAAGPIASLANVKSFKALDAVRQHVSLVSNLYIPTYNPALNQAFIPGGAHSGQHGFTRGPMLCGMGSYDSMQIPQACKTASQPGSQTCDQYAADAFGSQTRFRSLELKVQAVPYNGNPSAANGSMSARKQGSVVSALAPMTDPVAIYDMLFSGLSNTPTNPTTPTNPAPSQQLVRDKSVLDLVLADANRLSSQLSGEDKARLDLHFEEIRAVERNLAAQMNPGGGGSGPVMGCTKPARPAAVPGPNTMQFGGWAEETLRGTLQADLIAYAIACDLTRVVTWMITHDQCWLNSNKTGGSTTKTAQGSTDIHNDSHTATPDVVAANANWHASLYGKLIANLASKSDAGGTLLNNTFMALLAAEGSNAHSRSGFTIAVAGNPSRIKNGHHILTNQEHPAKVLISGLQSIGVNMSTLGQVSGTIPGLLI